MERSAACACGSAVADHPTAECSEAHDAAEFDPEGHAARVAANFPVGSAEHEVALYHDHIEDGLGPVPDAIRGHVVVLTRREGEPYTDYIERVAASGDSVAVAVKLADARDNLARCRGEFDGYVNLNLARRYEYVLRRLA